MFGTAARTQACDKQGIPELHTAVASAPQIFIRQWKWDLTLITSDAVLEFSVLVIWDLGTLSGISVWTPNRRAFVPSQPTPAVRLSGAGKLTQLPACQNRRSKAAHIQLKNYSISLSLKVESHFLRLPERLCHQFFPHSQQCYNSTSRKTSNSLWHWHSFRDKALCCVMYQLPSTISVYHLVRG